jgi:hypothetical protein
VFQGKAHAHSEQLSALFATRLLMPLAATSHAPPPTCQTHWLRLCWCRLLLHLHSRHCRRHCCHLGCCCCSLATRLVGCCCRHLVLWLYCCCWGCNRLGGCWCCSFGGAGCPWGSRLLGLGRLQSHECGSKPGDHETTCTQRKSLGAIRVACCCWTLLAGGACLQTLPSSSPVHPHCPPDP